MFGLKAKKQLEDEEAMIRFQNGDAGAFDILLHRHSTGVLRFIMNMTAVSKSNAEDLLQEIFIKVIEKRKQYNPNKKFTTWLYTITKNRCIDYLKAERHRRHSSLDAPLSNSDCDGPVKLEIVRANEKDQEERVIDREIRALLKSGLANLREEFREVFLLREIEGLSFKEISEITEAPDSTVKSRLRYAYEGLREVFAAAGFFEEKERAEEG